jgi:hypothetical protein
MHQIARMKILYAGLVFLTATHTYASDKSPKGKTTDPHASHSQWRSLTTTAVGDVSPVASRVTFESTSSAPTEAADIFDFWLASDPVLDLTPHAKVVLAKVTIKAAQIRLKESGEVLAAGEYYYWMGQSDGVWFTAFTRIDDAVNHFCPAMFTALRNDHHEHVLTLTHSPEEALQLKAMQGGPIRHLPPPPPPPPARCFPLWNRVRVPTTDPKSPPQYVCVSGGWMQT